MNPDGGKYATVLRYLNRFFRRFFVAVVLLGSLAAGFLAAVLWGLPRGAVRALSLEVGMQNSGLAIALAGLLRTQLETTGQFPGSELALLAVLGVLFSVWHNVTGPLLASVWNESA